MTPRKFLAKFGMLADTPNGVSRLRELILQLAVQGKLVPQNPKDEPASVLLEKIQSEKDQLVVAGKIKRTKTWSSPDVTSQAFPVPKTWSWGRLEDLSLNVHYGYTASADHSLTDVRMLRITDIQDNRVDWDTVPGCVIDNAAFRSYALSDGDILIARTGGTIGKSYLVTGLAIKAVFASYLIRVMPSIHILPRYLKLSLESPSYWNQIREKSSGTGQPNVNGKSLKSLLVPVPPVAEQRRIVAKVDQLMALCDELEEKRKKRVTVRVATGAAAIDKLLAAHDDKAFAKHWTRIRDNFDTLYDTPETVAQLRRAILQLAVQGKLVPQNPNDKPVSILLSKIKEEICVALKQHGKRKRSLPLPKQNLSPPFPIPSSWEWVRLSDICLSIESGWSPNCHARPKQPSEWGVLKISAVTWNCYDPNENKALPANLEPKLECEIRSGDFIMSRANTAELVGKSVVVEDTPPRIMLNDKLLRLEYTKYVDKYYANYYNNGPVARKYYVQISSGTSASMRNISRENLSEMLVPLPPLYEQHRIVAKVNRLMVLCDELEEKLKQAEGDGEKLMAAAVNTLLNDKS